MRKGRNFFLSIALVVSFLRRNAHLPQMVHDGVVQRLVAFLFADLNHARDLMRLRFAHQVRDRGVDDQDFERGEAARFVDSLEKILCDDAFERFGQRGANLVLLIGRENIDHAIDRFGRARSVKVPKTRWPVAAAVSASSIVSRSRISPTSRISGSSRSAPRKAEANERV